MFLSAGQSSQVRFEQAHSANEFIDSIGVNTHLSHEDTTYYKAYSEIIQPRLRELGVRHIRDDAWLNNPAIQTKFNELAKFGIELTSIVGFKVYDYAAEVVPYLKPIIDAIEAVEGPNEWDVFTKDDAYNGQKFPIGLRNFQTELYAAVKSDPITAHLPVIAPSIVDRSYAARLGNVPCDYGNMHNYMDTPNDDSLSHRWIPDARRICPNQSIVATESGWNNVVNVEFSRSGVSEQASGKYVPRLYLELFNQGIKRTFMYEFINPRFAPDEDVSNMGLLHDDGSPKPAFNALKNLILLLKDFGADVTLESLSYALMGNTDNIHHTLLQKSNGNFYLILWQEVRSFNLRDKTEITVPDQNLVLALTTPIKQAITYQPFRSIDALSQFENPNQLRLAVPDHPLVVELVPEV